MAIDIDSILDAAAKSAADAVGKAAPQAEALLRELGRGHEKALKALAEALRNGDIDQATFDQEMIDEGTVFEAELLAVSVIAKAVAQRAVNAFRTALIEGISAALKAIV